MKWPKYMLIIVLIDRLPANAAIPIVVPNAAENVEGNDAGYTPFSDAIVQQTRYQQVYHASQFLALPRSGAYITGIQFRPDCEKNSGFAVLTNTQVNLSTTPKQPDQLSAVFAENVAPNETLVFGPKIYRVGAGGGACPTPSAFQEDLLFDTPFFYNPAQGNLLMEVRFNGASYSSMYDVRRVFALDAVNSTNDAVSRIFARASDATVATQVDSVGLVTLFEFNLVPSLTNSLTTNTLAITWPVRPNNFVLQWTDSIGTGADWRLYTDAIGGNDLYHVLTLPRDSLQGARFFRLACPTCPPIPLSSHSAATSAIKQPTLVR